MQPFLLVFSEDVLRFAARGGTPLLAGVVAGTVTSVLAWKDRGQIDVGFYSLCAQVFPVFVIALVIERGAAARVGTSENAWVRKVLRARSRWDNKPAAPPDAVERYIEDWGEQYEDYVWVRDVPGPELKHKARAMYRQKVAVASGTILFAVTALVVGQVASLVDLLAGGTSADSAAFLLTTSMLAAAFTVIVASAAGELFRGLVRGA